MQDFKLIYNPYKVHTELYLKMKTGEDRIDDNSSMAYIMNKGIQKWLYPNHSWRGFFKELSMAAGDNDISVSFIGTPNDYEEFAAAGVFAQKQYHLSVETRYDLNKDEGRQMMSSYRLELLKEYAEMVQNGEYASLFLPEQMMEYIEAAEKKYYEVVIAAPVSAGEDELKRLLEQFFWDHAGSLEYKKVSGGNNFLPAIRKEIGSRYKNVMLFVFDPDTAIREETGLLFKEIARAMKEEPDGGERFLFVCTGGEKFVDGKPPYEEDFIRRILSASGIAAPNLFFVSTSYEKEEIRQCLAEENCNLCMSASVSERVRQQYAEKLAKAQHTKSGYEEKLEAAAYGAVCTDDEIAVLEKRLEETKTQIAWMNSGIPTLETAISEYLERSALTEKVRKLCGILKEAAEKVDSKTDIIRAQKKKSLEMMETLTEI